MVHPSPGWPKSRRQKGFFFFKYNLVLLIPKTHYQSAPFPTICQFILKDRSVRTNEDLRTAWTSLDCPFQENLNLPQPKNQEPGKSGDGPAPVTWVKGISGNNVLSDVRNLV